MAADIENQNNLSPFFFPLDWLLLICVSFDFVYFSYVKHVVRASLKMFQKCFRMFQNDLETKLQLFVLNRYFN